MCYPRDPGGSLAAGCCWMWSHQFWTLAPPASLPAVDARGTDAARLMADRSWDPADRVQTRRSPRLSPFRYGSKTNNNNEKSVSYRYNEQVSMRDLGPGCRGWAMARGRCCFDGNASPSGDEPIGVVHAHSSVLGGALALIAVPESIRHDIAEWRSS